MGGSGSRSPGRPDRAWLDGLSFRISAAPEILVQPTNTTVYAGQTARFEVQGIGYPLPSYQWYFDGTPLPGATNPLLELANVTRDQAGVYSVVLSNSVGAVVSSNALLLVETLAPQWITQPRDQKVFEGEEALFYGAVDAYPPATFQWLFEGEPLPVETNATVYLRNVALAQAGGYSLVVSNEVGSSISDVARLTVLAPDDYPERSGGVDPRFCAGFGPSGYLKAVLPLPDGRVLVGGFFNAPTSRAVVSFACTVIRRWPRASRSSRATSA